MSKQDYTVLMLPSWYLPEGGHFCRNQAQALNLIGIKTNILANVTLSWKKYKYKSLTLPWFSFSSNEDNLLVYRNYFRGIPFMSKYSGLIWSYSTYLLFKKYYRKHGRPNIIHVHSALWASYAAYLIKKKYNIPYIVTEHRGIFGLSCDYARNQFIDWNTQYLQKGFSNASCIVPVSEKQIAQITTFLNKPIDIKVISNLVDTTFFKYKERHIGDVVKFVAVNGFNYVKAYDILFPAFDKACDTNPQIYLTIVGEDFVGHEFNKLWSTVKHKNKITFTGELDMLGVRNELWKANAYIISSRVEAQPVSTLEALSTGLPVVCTDIVPDSITNQSNSIKVEVENIDSLTNAIIQMASNFHLYNGRSISEEIEKIASYKSVTNKLTSLYENIID